MILCSTPWRTVCCSCLNLCTQNQKTSWQHSSWLCHTPQHNLVTACYSIRLVSGAPRTLQNILSIFLAETLEQPQRKFLDDVKSISNFILNPLQNSVTFGEGVGFLLFWSVIDFSYLSHRCSHHCFSVHSVTHNRTYLDTKTYKVP